mgnify:CR=1 FL=1
MFSLRRGQLSQRYQYEPEHFCPPEVASSDANSSVPPPHPVQGAIRSVSTGPPLQSRYVNVYVPDVSNSESETGNALIRPPDVATKLSAGRTVSYMTQSSNSNLFVGDSGASHVMVKSSENLSHIRKPKRDLFITCANSSPDAKIPIESKGTLKIKGLNSEVIKIEKVLCAGNLSSNLLSLGRLCDLGYDVFLTADKCYVICKVQNLKIDPVLSGFRSTSDKLWYFDLSPSTSTQDRRHKPMSLNTGVAELGRSSGNIELGRSRDSEPIDDALNRLNFSDKSEGEDWNDQYSY